MKFFKPAFSIGITVILLSGVFGFAKTSTEEKNVEWKARMRAMLGDVLVLFPYAFDESKAIDQKNAATVKQALESLGSHSTDLKNHAAHLAKSGGQKVDPAYAFIAEDFETEVSLARTSFVDGGAEATQTPRLLRSALSKCIMCHTQSANGPELKLEQFKTQLASLSRPDRFMALTVTRQFDEALNEFKTMLAESRNQKLPESQMDRSAKTALAIVVRIKRDPKRAIELVDSLISSKAGSTMLQSDAKSWKQSLVAWSKEKPKDLKSDQALFDEAVRLQNSPEKPTVDLLRASSYLHELLSNYPQSPLRAKTYLTLASIYSELPGFAVWDLENEYLSACIRENPHSAMAEKCFAAYKDSMILGYTGSSGTHIPPEVLRHLKEMDQLSKAKPAH